MNKPEDYFWCVCTSAEVRSEFGTVPGRVNIVISEHVAIATVPVWVRLAELDHIQYSTNRHQLSARICECELLQGPCSLLVIANAYIDIETKEIIVPFMY